MLIVELVLKSGETRKKPLPRTKVAKISLFFADLMPEQQHPVGFNVQSAFIGAGRGDHPARSRIAGPAGRGQCSASRRLCGTNGYS